jgi:hypothetical protein
MLVPNTLIAIIYKVYIINKSNITEQKQYWKQNAIFQTEINIEMEKIRKKEN